MQAVAVLVCLILTAGLLVGCSSAAIATHSKITPTPSDAESLMAARIVKKNDAVLEATVREKVRDIYVSVVVADDISEAAAVTLIHRIIEQLSELMEGDNYSYSVMVSNPDGRAVVSAVADSNDRFLDKEDRR